MSCSHMLLAERLSSHASSGPRPRQNVSAEAPIFPSRRARRGQNGAFSGWHSQSGGSRGSCHTARQQTACAAAQRRQQAVVHVATAEAPVETSMFDDIAAGTERKYLMISGKGGVGKTSLAASLAVRLAAAGHQTLVVSTDPAHSLSDSLAQDVSGGQPVAVEGTDLPLWGMEVDPEQAKDELRASMAKDDGAGAKSMMSGMGLGMVVDQLADLKLGELLDTPPPGLDEAVAIAKVVQFVRAEEYARFSRIIFDTAPTGHTLRLLAVPDFVDASLGKIIRLRKKLGAAGTALRGLFGASEQQDSAVQKLESLRESVVMVRDLFRDADTTEFVIATIPTVLGVNESGRLLRALRHDNIPCKRIIVNQVITESMGEKYLAMKLKDQERAIAMLAGDPQLEGLRQIQAPLVDLEVRGVPALSYFGRMVWAQTLPDMSAGSERKYFMLGGKGGVGKTSSAASLAVQLAAEGHPTLVVSTDPAHSLSDSLDQDVSGGMPVAVEGTELPLWGMEIDVERARAELREMGQAGAAGGGSKVDDFMSGVGLGALQEQLKDLRLGELLDTLPPGVDELVAISKVVAFLKAPEYAKFSRIIFDTAPTGHTLRLLTLPDFIDATIGKNGRGSGRQAPYSYNELSMSTTSLALSQVIRLRAKLTNAAASVKGLFGVKSEKDAAVQKLEALKERMEEARQLFRNKDTTEFVIVTIPTVMAAAESGRLAVALRTEGVPVNTIVINQVVQPEAGLKFLAARRADQQRALKLIQNDPQLRELQVTEAPLVDLEVRGVSALQYFGGVVWK